MMLRSARSLGIVPGQGPGSDRPDSDFRASNQDRSVRMLVHMVHQFFDHASDLDECGLRSITLRSGSVERCWSGPRPLVRAPAGRPLCRRANRVRLVEVLRSGDFRRRHPSSPPAATGSAPRTCGAICSPRAWTGMKGTVTSRCRPPLSWPRTRTGPPAPPYWVSRQGP